MNFDEYILKKTEKDYDLISDKFSETRNKPWKEFEFLFEEMPEGVRVLDLGCGNGRFYQIFKEKKVEYVGIDKSEKLIEKAKENFPEADFVVGDGLDMPFSNDEFDYVFSIAVFHHIPSEKMRIKFLKEIKRVLKKDGKLRLSVWNLISTNKKIYFKNIKEKITGKIGLRDVFLPWKNNQKEVVTRRYYHFFKEKELEKLAEKSGFEVEKIFSKGKGVKSNIFLFAKNED